MGDVAGEACVGFFREMGPDAGYIDHVKYCAVILLFADFQRSQRCAGTAELSAQWAPVDLVDRQRRRGL
jgi:hypothetical protein